MTKLEKKFNKELKKRTMKDIVKHLEKACAELDAAVKISQEEGITFYSSISFLSQSFDPVNGWEHSAICLS